MFLWNWNGFVAKTQFGIVLQYFCRIGMVLRLRQNLELFWNISVGLKLDLECFCPKRREKRDLDLK